MLHAAQRKDDTVAQVANSVRADRGAPGLGDSAIDGRRAGRAGARRTQQLDPIRGGAGCRGPYPEFIVAFHDHRASCHERQQADVDQEHGDQKLDEGESATLSQVHGATLTAAAELPVTRAAPVSSFRCEEDAIVTNHDHVSRFELDHRRFELEDGPIAVASASLRVGRCTDRGWMANASRRKMRARSRKMRALFRKMPGRPRKVGATSWTACGSPNDRESKTALLESAVEACETGPPTCVASLLTSVQPHSLKPHTWHFTHPSAYSICDPQSGHVPMNASAA